MLTNFNNRSQLCQLIIAVLDLSMLYTSCTLTAGRGHQGPLRPRTEEVVEENGWINNHLTSISVTITSLSYCSCSKAECGLTVIYKNFSLVFFSSNYLSKDSKVTPVLCSKL